MARPIQSTHNRHGVIAHQGINAHQGESFLNGLSDEQAIKRIFVHRGQLIQPADMGPLHRQQQPTFLLHNPTMNLCKRQIEIQLAQLHLDLDLPEIDHTAADLVRRVSDAATGRGREASWLGQPPDQHAGVEKETLTAQGNRKSSARGASKSAWVCILPSRPPGWRGADTGRVAASSKAASRARTWLRSSADSCSSWCCSDGLMEVMVTSTNARLNPRWVDSGSPLAPRDSLHDWLKKRQEVR